MLDKIRQFFRIKRIYLFIIFSDNKGKRKGYMLVKAVSQKSGYAIAKERIKANYGYHVGKYLNKTYCKFPMELWQKGMIHNG